MNQYTPMTKYGLTNLGMGFFIHSVFMPFHCLCFWFCQNRKKKILRKKIIRVILKKIIELPKLLQNGKQTCSKRHRPTVLIHFLATGCFQMFDKIPVLSIRGRENIQFRESAHKQHSSWVFIAVHFLLLYRYFIFTSFWAYKIYYVYGFMLLVFIILTIVTVCVTIVCTYFLLNAEDYRWYMQSVSLFSSSL